MGQHTDRHPDNSFDLVTCVVSIDYLIHPLEILKEIGRVLKPGVGTRALFKIPVRALRLWEGCVAGVDQVSVASVQAPRIGAGLARAGCFLALPPGRRQHRTLDPLRSVQFTSTM